MGYSYLMNKNTTLDLLKENRGRNLRATWRRNAKVRKGVTALIEKETIAAVRTGINFANLSSVKEGIAKEERQEVQPLQWGQWKEFPFVIEHKGNDYLRLYPASSVPFVYEDGKAVCTQAEESIQRPKVKWFLDGREIPFVLIQEFLLASEHPKPIEETPICFTIKFNDLVSLQ